MFVKIVNPSKINGEIMQPGEDVLELDDADARALIESGSAVEAEMTPAPRKPEDGDQLGEAIRSATDQLDADDGEAWTKSGKPKTEAIEAILGYSVTAAERDAALADA